MDGLICCDIFAVALLFTRSVSPDALTVSPLPPFSLSLARSRPSNPDCATRLPSNPSGVGRIWSKDVSCLTFRLQHAHTYKIQLRRLVHLERCSWYTGVSPTPHLGKYYSGSLSNTAFRGSSKLPSESSFDLVVQFGHANPDYHVRRHPTLCMPPRSQGGSSFGKKKGREKRKWRSESPRTSREYYELS